MARLARPGATPLLLPWAKHMGYGFQRLFKSPVGPIGGIMDNAWIKPRTRRDSPPTAAALACDAETRTR